MIKTIDIIVPFFNEEDVFEKFVQSLDLVRKKIELDEALKLNYIFVDNGSSDTTFEKISEYENKNKNVTLIKLIRNFGIDGALKAGIDKAKGDAAILIHGDLQDNPEIIINLVNEWGNGFEHVIVRYSFQNRENLFRKLGSYFYYKWANYASSNLIIKGDLVI